MFLQYLGEEEAFWCLHSLMTSSRFNHRVMFMRDFPKIGLYASIIERTVKQHFPRLHRAFLENSMPFLLIVPQWFMVAFLNANLDFQLSAYIYDQFLAFGLAPLLSFGLALFELNKDLPEANTIINNITHPSATQLSHTIAQINSAWAHSWVTTREFSKMLHKFENLHQ
jgi:hypothetical protein